MSDDAQGPVMRRPAADVLDTTGIGRYVRWLAAERDLRFDDYDALWEWSVAEPEDFWESIWDHFAVDGDHERVLGSTEMPGAQWFPGSTVNYARHMLRHALSGEADDDAALIARSQTRRPVELTFAELVDQVGRARAGLQRLGVEKGDRVVAYLPNIPEALVAFLAAASLGATWASCAPEFGSRSVVDRFAQVAPTVLLTVGGYTHGAKAIDKSKEVAAIRAGLPSVRHVVAVPFGPVEVPDAMSWDELLAEPGPPDFDPVPFDHPLYVLFSSGTTGLPKVIVHSHGGILLEHLKLHALHLDTRPGDRALWFTTTAWAMWNITISAMLVGGSLVLLDGNPLFPDLEEQWRIVAETGASLLGTSPGYLMACRAQGVRPTDLLGGNAGKLRQIGVTGAPLPGEAFDWIAEQFGDDVLTNSISGGTDVCSAFVGGGPWQPVYRGEISGPCLGVDVTAFDAGGKEIVDELGELVVRAPMPSMPVRFWDDPGDERYREAYFDTYPGVWRHGDWVIRTRYRSFVVTGRSDATLNRGGVRLGTAEFYSVVEDLPEIDDSLVVHLEDSTGATSGNLMLFVVLRDGADLDDALRARIRDTLRAELSPRHAPDLIAAVPAVPRTLTGKKLEKPIKQVLLGKEPDEVISADAVSDFDAVGAYRDAART